MSQLHHDSEALDNVGGIPAGRQVSHVRSGYLYVRNSYVHVSIAGGDRLSAWAVGSPVPAALSQVQLPHLAPEAVRLRKKGLAGVRRRQNELIWWYLMIRWRCWSVSLVGRSVIGMVFFLAAVRRGDPC